MSATLERDMAEQATGIRQRSRLGKYYAGPINRGGHVSDPGTELTADQALEYLHEGGCVGVPNAGAGSYREFFASVGFDELKVIEQCSSAGDWTFGVRKVDVWCIATQENRYPHHGFNYSVCFETAAPTFKALCDANF